MPSNGNCYLSGMVNNCPTQSCARVTYLQSAGSRQSDTTAETYELRPHTLSILSNVVQNVFLLDSGSTQGLLHPLKQVDGAQTVLLVWGPVMPWSWSLWHDPRKVGAETITYLVSMSYFYSSEEADSLLDIQLAMEL